jgi:NAD(P)-dependent dehydrogenase (short-subunit alcohol dehydrogenase family)
MPPSIVVFGAGPGLGRSVARRYAKAGYTVVLAARCQAPLEELAADLAGIGATAHVFTADLSDTDAVPQLAGQIRGAVGDPDTLYYGVSAGGFFIPVAALTPERAQALMPLALYSLLALVQEFLPPMLERGDGAILSAQGASAVRGMPHISGGFALAAQRNYLQSLHAAVADQGVYVAGLYIGAAIKHTPFYERREAERAAGTPVPDMPEVDPDDLAELLWTMHSTKSQPEATYPSGLSGH